MPQAKNVLIPLELTTVVLAADLSIQNKIFRTAFYVSRNSGTKIEWSATATLIVSNKEMEDIMKIIKFLVED